MVHLALRFCCTAILAISALFSQAQEESLFNGPPKPGSNQRYSLSEFLEGDYVKEATDCKVEYGFSIFESLKSPLSTVCLSKGC